ncbi:MAG: cytidine deaminase [Acidobacteria bacterium]|nr:cytidine deaminase [Acidobacteriota bacterium]
MSISKEREHELILAASRVREGAYAPYSGFRVGAALLASDGRIFTGCNVENASYGLSMCAERNAVAAAIAAGARRFAAIVLVADSPAPVSPCGACRQVLAEFGDFPVIMVTTNGEREDNTVGALLPRAFSAGDMS